MRVIKKLITMKNLFTLVVAVLIAAATYGQDTQIDGQTTQNNVLTGERVQVGPYLYNFYEDNTCELLDIVETISGDIVLPSSVSYNGQDYKLTEINHDNDLGYGLVSDVTSLVIPEGVTKIACYFRAFQHVKSITVPSSVTTLSYKAFLFAMSGGYLTDEEWRSSNDNTQINNTYYDLERVDLLTDKLEFKSIDGVLFSQDGKTLLLCPRGRQGSYTVPDGVERLEAQSFRYCNKLTEVHMPASVKEIGDSPVEYNNGDWLFNNNIYPDVFSFCNQMKKIQLPEVEYISNRTFRYCWGLEDFVIPSTVKFIGADAFSYVPALESIDWNNCQLEGIASYAFIFAISGVDAFAVPHYTLSLPKHVKRIEAYAFSNCLAPESLILSPDLEYLGRQFVHFYNENSNATTSERLAPVKAIYNYRPVPLDVPEDVFGMDRRRVDRKMVEEFPQTWANECILYVPAGSAEAYKAHSVWGKFQHIQELETSAVKSVKDTRTATTWMHDLTGRAVAGNLKKGIYIVNGRKVVMR